jgi:hypothetical protein
LPPRRTDVDELVEEIAAEEPIITESKKPQLKTLIESTPLANYRTHHETGGKKKSKLHLF